MHVENDFFFRFVHLRIDFVVDPNNQENTYGPIYKNITADMNKINKSLR